MSFCIAFYNTKKYVVLKHPQIPITPFLLWRKRRPGLQKNMGCVKECSNYESLRWHRKTRQHILCKCRGLAAAAANWRGGTGGEAPKKHLSCSMCGSDYYLLISSGSLVISVE